MKYNFIKITNRYFNIYLLFFCAINLLAQQDNNISLEKSENFFPGWEEVKNQNIEWSYLTVPEDWNNINSKKIKIAVAILKSFNEKTTKAPVLFIQGGPGGGTINSIWQWFDHPFRNDRDIVLMDNRGTGFSQPKLCPNLGQEYLKILADDLSENEEIDMRITAAMKCRENLYERGIDINSYNSVFMSKDINALMTKLKHEKWNIYGVSYGTRVALEYSKLFPDDIRSLILDSPIPPNAPYYVENTSNYVRALEFLFNSCNKDPQCNSNYGDLRSLYIETIKLLEDNELNVPVEKEINSSGNFAFNSQDMVLAIHQGLYDKKLFEVLPIMIKEFNEGNKDMISALVSSLALRLSLDYGTYYSTLCNETIPFNSYDLYLDENKKHKDLIPGGITFYKSEFSICDKWNNRSKDKLISEPVSINKPALILSGEFDPIVPLSYGKLVKESIEKSFYLEIPSYGHSPSFSECGANLTASFLNNPIEKPSLLCYENEKNIDFAKNIKINKGVFKIALLFENLDFNKILPLLLVSFFLLLTTVIWLIIYTRSFMFNHVKVNKNILKSALFSVVAFFLVISTFSFLIYYISEVASSNFYILAFGLPTELCFFMVLPYLIVLIIIILIFLQFKNKTSFPLIQKWHHLLVILSLVVCVLYFVKWDLFY